jgi:ribonucleoside-diphosphate reductase beta chain
MGTMQAIMDASSELTIPAELYRRWERQQWKAQAIDFTKDRCDWLELPEQERWQWYWLAGLSHFRDAETHVVGVLSTVLPCLPRPSQQLFLATQIADEARHSFFFERFHEEVIGDQLPRPPQGQMMVSPAYQRLFFDAPTAAARNAAHDPTPAKVAIIAFHVFVVLEGAFALASLSVMRRLLTTTKRFPGLQKGMTYAQRDEVRHTQFGISLLQDIFAQTPAAREAVRLHAQEILPLVSKVLEVHPARKAKLESLGLNPNERRERAFAYLRRQSQVLGIGEALLEPRIAAA